MRDSRKGQGRKKDIKKIFSRVKDVLDLSSQDYVLVQFPSKYKERSIDIVTSGNEGNLVIRIKLSSHIGKGEVEDLIKASITFEAVPIIVSDDDELYDNIVYEKEGVFILNERTFENICLRRKELIAIYKKGELYVPLNKEVLGELRLRRDYSISELSYLTGISRRTLYEYEREGGLVSIEVAEKLVSTLGEDVIKSVDLKTMFEEFTRNVKVMKYIVSRDINDKVVNVLKTHYGLSDEDILSIFTIKKSAPDILIKSIDEEVKTIVKAEPKKYTLKDIVRKVVESIKIADLMGSEAGLILKREDEGRILDELSSQISTNKLSVLRIS